MDIAIPACDAATAMMGQVNKNPAVYFVESVFPDQREFGMAFANRVFGVDCTLSMHEFKWDEATRTMKSPNDEQEEMAAAMRNQEWARKLLGVRASGGEERQDLLPVEMLRPVSDDASTTTLNTKNRRRKGKREADEATYKGDAGAPTLVLGRKAPAKEVAGSGEEAEESDDGDDDASAVSALTTLSNKSVSRAELEAFRAFREKAKAGHYIDITNVDLAHLSLGAAGGSATADGMEEEPEEEEDLEMREADGKGEDDPRDEALPESVDGAEEQTKEAEEGAGAEGRGAGKNNLERSPSDRSGKEGTDTDDGGAGGRPAEAGPTSAASAAANAGPQVAAGGG